MRMITTTADLAAFCAEAATKPYVTVDTEFLRERTYYAKLCLVQMALPGTGDDGAVLVDPLAPGIDLAPLYALMADPRVVKVFHAARQDIEIFVVQAGIVPQPLFDTQVAAMVCGYGDQASYETLVRRIAKGEIDKSSRFTDWSTRPLSEAQLRYALADVTYLRRIYEHLAGEIAKRGRASWIADEMAELADPATYRTDPAEAWEKIRVRAPSAKVLAALRELARFREDYAQTKDVPRSRVFKDDALVELATMRPATEADLGKARLLLREGRRPDVVEGILAAVRRSAEVKPADLPKLEDDRGQLNVNPALADLLRVLLKARADSEGVAPKLIASAADLDALAAGQRDVKAVQGWRLDVFGADALRLCDGQLALGTKGSRVITVPV